MSGTVKVSVVVPVYNAETYLKECLDSICGQTLREIEILCVDDGSTDRSPEILAACAARDPRVQVIRQENAGAGPARNTGLARAAGDYLVFWDADDFFDPTALEKLFRRCEADKADICVCGGYTFFVDTQETIPSGTFLKASLLPEKLPFSIQDSPEHILDFTAGTVWNKMFRRAFTEAHQLTFLSARTCEDANYVAKALCMAERITAVNERLVTYRTAREESLSFSWSRSVEDPINAWIEAAEVLRAAGLFPERSFSNKALSVMLGMLRKASSSWDAFREAAARLKGGALAEMGVVEREPGYYYELWKEECLHHLLQDSTEEFLCFYLYSTYKRLQQASGYRRQEKELKKAQEELAALKSSRTYRAGQAVLWLPDKLRQALKGK